MSADCPPKIELEKDKDLDIKKDNLKYYLNLFTATSKSSISLCV